MPFPWAAAIGGLVSGATSMFSNKGALQRQNTANAQNLEFWNKQNAYNTPTQQMARLKAAGLNPNLIYGSGAANTGNASSIAPSKTAPYNVKDPTPSAMQTALISSQIGLQRSQEDKNYADAENTRQNMPPKVAEAGYRAAIAKIESINLSAEKKHKIEKMLQDAISAKINKKELQSKFDYDDRLRKMGMNPQHRGEVMPIIQTFMTWLKQMSDWSGNPENKNLQDHLNKPPTYNRAGDPAQYIIKK